MVDTDNIWEIIDELHLLYTGRFWYSLDNIYRQIIRVEATMNYQGMYNILRDRPNIILSSDGRICGLTDDKLIMISSDYIFVIAGSELMPVYNAGGVNKLTFRRMDPMPEYISVYLRMIHSIGTTMIFPYISKTKN